MRTSPFAPSRTAALLMPFFVIPAIVLFGTPTAKTLKPHRATSSTTPHPTGPGIAAANVPGTAESILHRATDRQPPAAGQGANRSQSLRAGAGATGWTAAHAMRRTPVGRVRANPTEVVEARGVLAPSTESSSGSDDAEEARSEPRRRGSNVLSHNLGPSLPRSSNPTPQVRLGAPIAPPPAVGGTAAQGGSWGSQSYAQIAQPADTASPGLAQTVGEDALAFPLGTSVSLADRPKHHPARLVESSRHSFGTPAPGDEPAAFDKESSSSGTIVPRAQEPDPPESLPADVPSALTWREAQQRLRTMGASRYRLETWGDDGQFRFTCSVPLESNSPINRHFEARAADPMLAVAQVLDDIERWRQRQ